MNRAKFRPTPIFTVFAVLGAICQPMAEGAPDAPLDLKKFPADLVDQVVVPVPGEIFAILDKLGEAAWAAELRPPVRASFRGRTDYALALGVAVADGFVAVQARDKAGVESAGKAVLARAEALGLRKAVTTHCQAIFDAVKAGEWGEVRKEFDLTETTARTTMEKMGDKKLATCVSLGGWVRGTQVASAVISKSFTADKAELLNQPDLVEHFAVSVRAMEAEGTSASPKLQSVAGALAKVAGLMGDGEKPVPSDAVVGINETCAALVDAILGVAPAKTGEGEPK